MGAGVSYIQEMQTDIPAAAAAFIHYSSRCKAKVWLKAKKNNNLAEEEKERLNL